MRFLKLFAIISVIFLTSINCFSSSQHKNEKYAVVSVPDIPESITFCGEKVHFDRIDMAERLDRELTTTIFSHTQTTLIIKRANRFFPRLAELLKEYKMPDDLIYLAVAESSMDINALSSAGAAGIWQFMPATAKQYGLEVNEDVDERFDPEKETVAACKYFKDAYSKFHKWTSVCASYNAGMGRITNELQQQQASNALDLRLVNETSRYVFRIIAYKIFLNNPKQFGYSIHRDQLYQPIEYKTVTVSTPVDNWVTWAKNQGISYAQLRDANPWIRSYKLPNSSGKVYKIKIPTHKSLYRSKAGNKVYNNNWVVD